METTEYDDYIRISEVNRNVNGILTIIQERVRFSYKDRQKFINPFI